MIYSKRLYKHDHNLYQCKYFFNAIGFIRIGIDEHFANVKVLYLFVGYYSTKLLCGNTKEFIFNYYNYFFLIFFW